MSAFRSPFDRTGPAPGRSPRRPALLLIHRRALDQVLGSDAPLPPDPGTGQPTMRRQGGWGNTGRIIGVRPAGAVQVY